MRTLLSSAAIVVALTGAAAACPSITTGVSTYTVTGEYLYTPRNYDVTAGGNIDLDYCASVPGTGNVIQQPDFSFYTSGMAAYDRLEIEVIQQSCDTILLVNSANASWFFDDDSNGDLRPVINLRGTSNTEGRIDVWVGTYNDNLCSATLQMETW